EDKTPTPAWPGETPDRPERGGRRRTRRRRGRVDRPADREDEAVLDQADDAGGSGAAPRPGRARVLLLHELGDGPRGRRLPTRRRRFGSDRRRGLTPHPSRHRSLTPQGERKCARATTE